MTSNRGKGNQLFCTVSPLCSLRRGIGADNHLILGAMHLLLLTPATAQVPATIRVASS